MYDIISIGGAVVDITVTSDQFILRPDILGLAPSSKNEIKEGIIGAGGGAVNTSVSFSRLGLKSACCSLLGDDILSKIVRKSLSQNKVTRRFLIHYKKESTDYSVILVGPDGSRSVLTDRGKTHLESSQIKWRQLKKTKWLYITSLEGNISLIEKIIGYAYENQIGITLNPGRRELKSSRLLIPLLKYVDVLLLNKTESQDLTGLAFEDSRFWPKLLNMGAKICVVTNGRDGAYITTSVQKLYSPILNVVPVDELGAGDAFGSAFTAALIHGHDLQTALNWGIHNSASVVSYLGAQKGLLTLNQITHATKTHKDQKE
jgi:sugar/nucleoside kinase (ribokinase family)